MNRFGEAPPYQDPQRDPTKQESLDNDAVDTGCALLLGIPLIGGFSTVTALSIAVNNLHYDLEKGIEFGGAVGLIAIGLYAILLRANMINSIYKNS